MVKLLILAIFVSLGLEANELSIPNIKNFQEAVKKTGTSPCSSCDGQYAVSKKTAEVYSPYNRKTVELSVLTPERAKEVFELLKNDEDNSFNYTIEGCFSRAHRMAQLLDQMGILSGKTFAEGEFYMQSKYAEFGWSFHSASLVLVPDKNNKLVPTVFDPALFNQPVSVEEWKKRLLLAPNSKLERDFFTTRFHYGPGTANSDLSNYDEDELEEARLFIKEHRRMGEMLEMLDPTPRKIKRPSGK